MKLITTDEVGQVKVGDTILPGVFESLEITGSVKMDEVEIQGKKEKVTQAVGYENTKVRLNIALLPDTEDGDCSQAVEMIQRLFRQAPNQEKPGVFKIVSKHLIARGVDQVTFSSFKTYEDNRINKIIGMCEFTEYVPVQVKVAQKGSTTTPAPVRRAPVAKTNPPKRTIPKGGMFNISTKTVDKTKVTPAKDSRKPSLGKKILAWLGGKKIG